jgi:hypothetical protein
MVKVIYHSSIGSIGLAPVAPFLQVLLLQGILALYGGMHRIIGQVKEEGLVSVTTHENKRFFCQPVAKVLPLRRFKLRAFVGSKITAGMSSMTSAHIQIKSLTAGIFSKVPFPYAGCGIAGTLQ